MADKRFPYEDTEEELEVIFEDGSLPDDMRWLLGGMPLEIPDPVNTINGVPREFVLAGEEHRVEGVADTWPDPDFIHYKVRTSEGSIYLLHYHIGTDTWLGQLLRVLDS